ncbi:hypothetical protein [Spongiactinospora sp. TRM90649]|uniref:hypothetical protein n=1 Tax=Spongiactinospora sp. TRM90649 TaxID=3031114 RepID=UPI0023F76F76|nr:hypothetical protein [Spongiactinospora sp. TRM90649]MDF5754810.1 hypothetical protein [Spongiactinospora sp. TRM90649]
MRRYRFGKIAALIALGYFIAVVLLAVLALTTTSDQPVWTVVTQETDPRWYFGREEAPFVLPGWLALVLVPIGAVQGWALWQVLRGRLRGELTDRGRHVALLRLFLYLTVGYSLILTTSGPLIRLLEISWFWSVIGTIGCLVQLAVVWLFFLVLRGSASRGLRVFSLITGLISTLSALGEGITDLFDLDFAGQILNLAGGYGYGGLVWSVTILIAQARDPRWSAATVRIGVIAQAMTVLQPHGMVTFDGEFPGILTFFTLVGAVSVFGLVWDARTAHELANPLPEPVPRAAPVRATTVSWPLAVLAIALPLAPAAVNLAQGRYHWTGPRGVIEYLARAQLGSGQAMAWLGLDVFIGVGGPALLILAAVLRRTPGIVRLTTRALTIAAAVGLISALTTVPTSGEFDFFYDGTQIYPEGLFTQGQNGEVWFGISPLWYSAALIGSALLLRVIYASAFTGLARYYVVSVRLVTLIALGFTFQASRPAGSITTGEECTQAEYGTEMYSGEAKKPALTRDQRIVCSLRKGDQFKFTANTPDAGILSYARRLCGVYTRNDPAEVARLQATTGLRRDALTYPLAEICPSAGAVVSAAAAEQNREMQEWEDDSQRMCDTRPVHRPLIKPAKAVRLKEPQFTDYGVVSTYEPTGGDEDPAEGEEELLSKAQDNGLVAAHPGQLVITTHSDYDLCVTLETYTRRPPVETKGWDQVTEVGYESPTGEIVLTDDLSGTTFPDLSLNGRPGHYRIRVHYDWFNWKGLQENGQRLLIMAYPAKGDKPITYRKPRRK